MRLLFCISLLLGISPIFGMQTVQDEEEEKKSVFIDQVLATAAGIPVAYLAFAFWSKAIDQYHLGANNSLGLGNLIVTSVGAYSFTVCSFLLFRVALNSRIRSKKIKKK